MSNFGQIMKDFFLSEAFEGVCWWVITTVILCVASLAMLITMTYTLTRRAKINAKFVYEQINAVHTTNSKDSTLYAPSLKHIN